MYPKPLSYRSKQTKGNCFLWQDSKGRFNGVKVIGSYLKSQCCSTDPCQVAARLLRVDKTFTSPITLHALVSEVQGLNPTKPSLSPYTVVNKAIVRETADERHGRPLQMPI